MNYEQPRFPHPRPQPPAQPPQRADAGADPAAAIAARTAAVARNRQKSERAALIHDMLRIVCVAVLIGGVCLYAYLKHRQNMAEERQRAEQANGDPDAANGAERMLNVEDARASPRKQPERGRHAPTRQHRREECGHHRRLALPERDAERQQQRRADEAEDVGEDAQD